MAASSQQHVRQPQKHDSEPRHHSPLEAATGSAGGLTPLRERYEAVMQRIADAAKRSGRRPDEIVLVAVTKQASIDEIRGLVELGHQDFGENRVQHLQQRAAVIDEFLARRRELGSHRKSTLPENVRWHMIGHLQRNKARRCVPVVRLVHSVDSLRLVEELHAIAARLDRSIEFLVQVNVADEKQKFGVAPAAVRHLLEQIDTMIGLRPRGLMCMAPASDDPDHSRPVFERGAELFHEIQTIGCGGDRFDILSMGMSGDFDVAVECGANMVRVGSAIFATGETGPDEDA